MVARREALDREKPIGPGRSEEEWDRWVQNCKEDEEYNSEEYALNRTQRGTGLDRLGVPRSQVWVDLFAGEKNAQETFFCSEDNSAFRHSWEDLSSGEDGAEPWLWANPPFKDYARVLGKLLK